MTKTEYKVSIELAFDGERAKALSQDRGVRVLVTNLPRAGKDAENIRSGATTDTVLRAYLDQYKVEHAFRLAKDGMKMSRVYIHRPSRENAMMFVISLGTMVSDVIGHVLKTRGIDTTTDGIAGRWFTSMFGYYRYGDSDTPKGLVLPHTSFGCSSGIRIGPKSFNLSSNQMGCNLGIGQ